MEAIRTEYVSPSACTAGANADIPGVSERLPHDEGKGPGGGHDATVRYAVVGLGHIAQVAILPAFDQATNSELVAVVSGDPEKRDQLRSRHHVRLGTDYAEYDDLVASGDIDAVYLALPHHLHREYTVRAARAGVHVLCEKPMAVTETECEEMIRACADAGVRLMIGYRLHFEPANLEAIEVVNSGRLGEPRFFASTFSQQVEPGNFRLKPISESGGSVYDMGVYCINAARYLFRAEPIEVTAISEHGRDARFQHSDEMTSAVLRFGEGRVAMFTSSFGATATSNYRVVGAEGELIMDPAYGYDVELSCTVIVGGRVQTQRTYPRRDQFALQLQYFSDCVLRDVDPEPDGNEGWADVRIIRAIYESAERGTTVPVQPVHQRERPSPATIACTPDERSTLPEHESTSKSTVLVLPQSPIAGLIRPPAQPITAARTRSGDSQRRDDSLTSNSPEMRRRHGACRRSASRPAHAATYDRRRSSETRRDCSRPRSRRRPH